MSLFWFFTIECPVDYNLQINQVSRVNVCGMNVSFVRLFARN